MTFTPYILSLYLTKGKTLRWEEIRNILPFNVLSYLSSVYLTFLPFYPTFLCDFQEEKPTKKVAHCATFVQCTEANFQFYLSNLYL